MALTQRQQAIADAVRESGLTIAAFCRACGVPDRTVRSWIDGLREPTDPMLAKVAAGLAAHVWELSGVLARIRSLRT